jgi:hypothetical protein
MVKDLDGSSCTLIQMLSRYLPEGTAENHGKSVRIVDVSVEIRTKHLQNISLERYSCTNLTHLLDIFYCR